MSKPPSPNQPTEKRKPGRPPTYVFSKPDSELSENERRLKGSVIKRRLRQNRSYHRKKRLKELAQQRPPSTPQPSPQSLPNTTTHTHPSHFVSHPLPLHLGQPVLSPHSIHTRPVPSLVTAQSSPPPLPSLSASPLAQNQTLPIPPTSASLYSSHTSAYTNSSPADSLTFLAINASRVRERATATTTTDRTVSTSHPSPPNRPSQPNPALDLTIPPEYDDLLAAPTSSISSRLDRAMMQPPPSNVNVQVQNSRGTPFLSLSPTTPAAIANITDSSSDEKDEAQLLADILDSTDRRQSDEVSTVPRGASARPFLNQDLDIRMSSLPHVAVQGLKHLVFFPGSFSADAALVVMGMNDKPLGSDAVSTLKPLVDVKLLRELPSGRFALNDITKSLIANDTFDDVRDARRRFVSYFTRKLQSLDPNSLSSKGETRLKAMKVYDVERNNMEVALQMCREIGGKRLIMEFLMLAATVMRYSTSAHDRVEIFSRVLSELESSSSREATDILAEARLRLALGEAYFDLLQLDTAEDQLRRAIAVMAGTQGGSLPVASSVLALLLLAELRISDHDFDEAKKLLVQALKGLKDAGLQKSTFAVCCLLSLASVYKSMKQSDEALRTVSTALEVLTDLGFSRMPIYADALGTLGSVHAQKGNLEEAQKLFYSALNIIQAWMTRKDWVRAPFQHCAHLDIFLVESIAQTYTAQERNGEAEQLYERARQQRQERGLAPHAEVNTAESNRQGRRYSRIYTRHLY